MTAILPSQGYGPGHPVATLHTFVETRECHLPSPDGEAYEYIYKCVVTGAERRWGTADREPRPNTEETN